MPAVSVLGLVLAHHDLKGVHAADWGLPDDHEDEVDSLPIIQSAVSMASSAMSEVGRLESQLSKPAAVLDPAALPAKEPSVVSGASMARAPSHASSVGPPGRRQSQSMLSVPSATAASAAPPRTGTYTSSTLIYVVSCFGASCLAMPWAYAQCGWGLALILMFAMAAVTQWGADMLLECAVKVAGDPSGGVSIKQIAMVATPRLTVLPELVVIINCLGSAMGALVVAGFLLPLTFQDMDTLQRHAGKPLTSFTAWDTLARERAVWITIVMAAVLPLCFLRDITPLKVSGVVSMVAVSFMMAAIAASYWLQGPWDTCELYGAEPCAQHVVAFSSSSSINNILAAIPVFAFNYSSNYQLLTVHNALAKKDVRTTSRASATCLSFCSLAYILGGLTAYFTFGERTLANILGNYGNSLAVDLARLFMIISVTLLFPLTIFTARVSVMSILGHDWVHAHNPKRVFFAVSFFLIGSCWLIAVNVPQINVILGVAGALSAVPITVLLPGQYLIALATPGPEGRRDRIKGRVAMYAGYALTIVCLYGSLAVGA